MGGEYHRAAFGASRQSALWVRSGFAQWRLHWGGAACVFGVSHCCRGGHGQTPDRKPRMQPSTGLRGVGDVRFKDLLESWRQNAAGVRTVSEYAVRLPVDDAARLQALAELFPGRAIEQIITDLLGAALQEVAAAMPYVPGKKVISTDEQGDPVYEDAGPTPRFAELTRKFKKKLEAEAKSRSG